MYRMTRLKVCLENMYQLPAFVKLNKTVNNFAWPTEMIWIMAVDIKWNSYLSFMELWELNHWSRTLLLFNEVLLRIKIMELMQSVCESVLCVPLPGLYLLPDSHDHVSHKWNQETWLLYLVRPFRPWGTKINTVFNTDSCMVHT